MGATKGFFLGSTGIKLLRKCPCPIWFTRPPVDEELETVHFAQDRRPPAKMQFATEPPDLAIVNCVE